MTRIFLQAGSEMVLRRCWMMRVKVCFGGWMDVCGGQDLLAVLLGSAANGIISTLLRVFAL